MPQNEAPITDFLNYLTFQKRYSAHTILSYKNDLTSFFEYLFLEYAIEDVKNIQPAFIRSWLASLKEQNFSSKTINRKISSLKSFFKHLLKIKIIESSPVAAISSLKVSRHLPSYISKNDISVLLKNDFFDSDFQGKTAALIFQILYQTGIRRSELIQLKDADIDKHSALIKVLGKGNKERLIPVNNQLIHLIEDYISEKKKFFEMPPETLLVLANGKPLYPKFVYNIVKNNLSKVSTNERKSPHVIRHSFATHLTNNGAQINAIKELLGHSSLAATQIYTHNTIEKLKEAHKLSHPKG